MEIKIYRFQLVRTNNYKSFLLIFSRGICCAINYFLKEVILIYGKESTVFSISRNKQYETHQLDDKDTSKYLNFRYDWKEKVKSETFEYLATEYMAVLNHWL